MGVFNYAVTALMTANAITMASDNEPAVMFRTLMLAVPAADWALSRYEPAVPALMWFIIRMSPASITVLVKVKLTVVSAASAALFSVIWPVDLLNVTPVALLVA